MKHLFLIAISLLLLSCSGKPKTENKQEVSAQGDRVEVIYFHGKQRCVTCRAIEQLTNEVLEATFRNQIDKGAVVYKVIDISDPQNEAITDKYEVTWSSLYINGWKGGKETVNNMTEFSFANAKGSPDIFRLSLKPWGIALKFLFLHHENILFPND